MYSDRPFLALNQPFNAPSNILPLDHYLKLLVVLKTGVYKNITNIEFDT